MSDFSHLKPKVGSLTLATKDGARVTIGDAFRIDNTHVELNFAVFPVSGEFQLEPDSKIEGEDLLVVFQPYKSNAVVEFPIGVGTAREGIVLVRCFAQPNCYGRVFLRLS